MGLLTRLRRGWAMGIDSVRVLVRDPELLAFPVLGTLAVAAVGVGLWVLTAGFRLVGDLAGGGPAGTAVLLAGAFVTAFVVTAVSTFFSAGLVHAAATALRGGEPDVADGLRAAWRVRRTILVWALAVATVSVVVRLLERQGQAGAVVRTLLGASWGVLTYFVVPALVLGEAEGLDVFAESARTVRDTWGETAGASAGVGVVVLLAFVAAVAAAVVGVLVLPGGLAFAGLLPLVALLVLLYPAGQAVTGVAKAALYLYAESGEQPAAFRDVDLAGALA